MFGPLEKWASFESRDVTSAARTAIVCSGGRSRRYYIVRRERERKEEEKNMGARYSVLGP